MRIRGGEVYECGSEGGPCDLRSLQYLRNRLPYIPGGCSPKGKIFYIYIYMGHTIADPLFMMAAYCIGLTLQLLL